MGHKRASDDHADKSLDTSELEASTVQVRDKTMQAAELCTFVK